MAHPYPRHWPAFDYRGRHSYALTFVTDTRRPTFTDADAVALAYEQILRAATKYGFAVLVYCFMPDHLHMLVTGTSDASDCKAFIKAAKQYSAYHFKQQRQLRLWERYSHDRVIREDIELVLTIRYIVSNPVVVRLVDDPRDYPFLGSQLHTVDELLEWCEYCPAMVERIIPVRNPSG